MSYINLFVLGSFIFLGVMLLLGCLFTMGSLVALAVFGGWFITVYSIVAYVFAAALYVYRRGTKFWITLYPVNFSLALIAILLFGIHGEAIFTPMAASFIFGACAALLVARSSLVNLKVMPLVLLVPLFLCPLSFLTPYWGVIFSFVAAHLLTAFADARLIRRIQLDN
jgi:hypothetical protein